jgi:DNA-binding NtrC family response regulator
MATILYVDDDPTIGLLLEDTLLRAGHKAIGARSVPQALQALSYGEIELIISDFKMPGMTGLEFLGLLREEAYDIPLIMVTGYASIEHAVLAIKAGAADYITKPVRPEQLEHAVAKALQVARLRKENDALRHEVMALRNERQIIGESGVMRRLLQTVATAAPTRATVLLQGESGTGKELFARAIHQLSPRRDRPFVAINCAAIPETLIENELFGHEKGSFTGATGRQLGKFELADSGTIFLDEIGELGLGVQSKILRVIQERRFDRIGGTSTLEVDVRIICATNRPIAGEVKEGRFREDLFFRINVFPVTVPPLRARREDIGGLAGFFLQKFARELKKPSLRISADAAEALRAYDWPGNIRELENCIERAAILCDGSVIERRDLHIEAPSTDALRDALDLSGTLEEASGRTLQVVERLKIAEALQQTASRADAAERLGISVRTLAAKMKEHGIEE